MIGAIESWFEFTSLGISELAAEVQKEKLLFGTNDSNKEGDKLWSTVSSPDKNVFALKITTLMETQKYIHLEHLMMQKLGIVTSRWLVLLIIQNQEKQLVLRKLHQLVYFSDQL